MQQVVYKCDQCKKEVGENKHISLRFSNESGIATPPDVLPQPDGAMRNRSWRVEAGLQGKFTHFCNAQCLQRYFSALMKSVGQGITKKI